MRRLLALSALAAAAAIQFTGADTKAKTRVPFSGTVSQGALMIRDGDGPPKFECPLKHTDVKAEISGFIARVTVTQEFENTSPDKIEAVYVFPLPHMGAVDTMNMQVGSRHVKGLIKRREEAQAIYHAAKNSGRVAALLDQERPNIFTQSVANILPGEKVKIEISYVETLKYEAGTYEWVFPMVVGPRYIPGAPIGGKAGGGWAADTDRVPDASRITPPVAKPGTRAGHDIALRVSLDAGVPIDGLSATSHQVVVDRAGSSRANVRLANSGEIPNKDFVLRYDVAGRKVSDAVLAHHGAKGGFFTLFLQPPDKINVDDITPKELVFVVDTSGSMHGFPLDKTKETMRLALNGMNPRDTFNVITFSGDTHILFSEPVAATPANIQRAHNFLNSHRGGGGTEMMKAIRAALDPSDSQKHLRIACFMTDGYVGNEAEIISEIKRHTNARVFSFGIGSSVNRYLLDKMAEAGRGEVEYVSLKDDGSAAAKKFYERLRNPLLTDIEVDWGGIAVSDVQPGRIPDLFSAKPVVLTGRYSAAGRGTIRLRGKWAGQPIVREIPVVLPANEPKHDVLASLWARTKIDQLSHERTDTREEITKLGLDFKLMTQFTSFVAVEETVVTDGGVARRVDVPVEIPEGVSYDGIFGREAEADAMGTVAVQGAGAMMARSSAPLPTMVRPEAANKALAREELRAEDKALKLDPALASIVGTQQVQVKVYLHAAAASVLSELKALGFVTIGKPSMPTVLIGKISASKLKQLSELKAVRYVAALK